MIVVTVLQHYLLTIMTIITINDSFDDGLGIDNDGCDGGGGEDGDCGE